MLLMCDVNFIPCGFFAQSLYPILKHAHTISTYFNAPLYTSSIPSLSRSSLHTNLSVTLTSHIHLSPDEFLIADQ